MIPKSKLHRHNTNEVKLSATSITPKSKSSLASVRDPESDGCIKRFFRALIDQLFWIGRFRSVEELTQALEQFRMFYNHHRLIHRLGFSSPQFRPEQYLAIEPAA